MSQRTDIKIDSGVAHELRKFAFEKHGTLHGTIKAESEAAILAHIKRG
jgi:hypothetical protein